MNPKDMTDQQINLKLARMCGYEEISEQEDMWVRKQRNDYKGKGVVVLYGDHYVIRSGGECKGWSPCNDPAASLEVQAAAIKLNARMYAINLAKQLKWDDTDELSFSDTDLFTYIGVANFFSATSRQRAEAAYMTLQEVESGE